MARESKKRSSSGKEDKSDYVTSQRNMSSGDGNSKKAYIPYGNSSLRNEISLESCASSNGEEDGSDEISDNDEISINDSNSIHDFEANEKAKISDEIQEKALSRLKSVIAGRSVRSSSFGPVGNKSSERVMVHTSSDGDFGRPLKTVFVPDSGSKAPSDTNLKQSCQSGYVPLQIISLPPNIINQPSKKVLEEKVDVEINETVPVMKKTSSIWTIIKGWLLFVIPENSHSFRFWINFIYLVHLFNLIVAPTILGWYDQFSSMGWIAAFFLIDLLFLVDCYLKAHSSFVDEYGIHITDSKQTIKRFISHQWGWLDIGSSLPLDFLVFSRGLETEAFRIWSILRFVKLVLRFPYKGVFNTQVPRVALPISRLIKTMVVLLFLGHLDGCLFWFMESYLEAPRWVDEEHLTHTVFSTQYLVSYISALKSLVLKLRSAYRDGENIYVIFEFIAGILAYGTVFGNIHSIVEMMDDTVVLNQAEERHKFEMERLRQYMREKELKPELQKMVNSHKQLQWIRSQGVDESKLFDDLPKSLQQEIKNFLYLDLFKKVPLFQDTDILFQHSVTLKIKPVHIIEGCYIFRKDDDGQEMFFIKSGQVEIVGDSGQIFVTLGTGSFFGEIALFKNCKRTASARAKGNVELCMLAKDDYNFILTQFPIISERIQRTIREREENEAKKKAEQAALEAAKKLEEERALQAAFEKVAREKLERESRPKSSLLGSIASLTSSIISRGENLLGSKTHSRNEVDPQGLLKRTLSVKASTKSRSFLMPGMQTKTQSFLKSQDENSKQH